jgi:signal transduction histidine kinase
MRTRVFYLGYYPGAKFRDGGTAQSYHMSMSADAHANLGLGPARNYLALFENSPIPVALISTRADPCVLAASRGFLDTVRRKRAEVTGRTLEQVFILGSGAKVAGSVRRCLLSSESVRTVASLSDGLAVRQLRLAVHPANAPGFAGYVLLEIQGDRHSGRASDERETHLMDEDRGLSFTYAHDLKAGRLRYSDEGLARRLGLSRSGTMKIEQIWALIHPEDVEKTPGHEALRRHLRDDEFVGATIRVRDKDDLWRLISLRARVLRRTRNGEIRTMLGVATDITAYTSEAIEAAGLSLHSVEQNERARIGRELHDSTSQLLVSADLGVGQILRGNDVSEDLRERLSGVRASLSMAQTEIRAFAFFLHPPELRELGLLKTLEKFCAGFSRRSGIAISFASGPMPEHLPSEIEHAFLRVCQEALMNVYRHAFARTAAVALNVLRGAELVLEVRDDGVGVDGGDRFEQGGMGVAGMRARMRAIGGELELRLAGPGLTVVARAPTTYPE